jgi:hypothetical protein
VKLFEAAYAANNKLIPIVKKAKSRESLRESTVNHFLRENYSKIDSNTKKQFRQRLNDNDIKDLIYASIK